MSSLIVMSRPGLMVVCGIIKKVDISASEVTIENDVYMPVSRRTERKKLRIGVNRNKISAMKLGEKIGTFILATVKPVTELLLLEDGGEDSKTEYYTMAYNIRFSGSFDFDSLGDAPESHVFCAGIRDKEFATIKGKTFAFLDISWKKSGNLEERKLVIQTSRSGVEALRDMKRGTFVTGPLQNTSYGPVYKVKRIVM